MKLVTRRFLFTVNYVGTVIGDRLETHETSPKHGENIRKWITIDKMHKELISKEKEVWSEVLKIINIVIINLAKHTIAFRGSNSNLYERKRFFWNLLKSWVRSTPSFIHVLGEFDRLTFMIISKEQTFKTN